MFVRTVPAVPAWKTALRDSTRTVKQNFQNNASSKKEAEKRISTDKGILLRMNRSIQVEGAFGVLKQDYGFGRFLTRGKTNNETRLFILATALNIRKLCSRLADGRFEKALFELKTA